MIRLIHGDCIEAMRGMEAESVHAVVCDPPYGLSKPPDMVEVLTHWLNGDDAKVHAAQSGGFMGSLWDSFVPGPATWKEAYRVLKPGGYLLAFAGSRTSDLMGVSIRLAGFEIRDGISWNYASGFPKNLDISKAIDKTAGAEREVIGYDASRARPNRLYESGAIGNIGGTGNVSDRTDNGATLTAPATPEATEWEGWGTALKPSQEPIIVARKPLIGTVVANVLAYGTGGLNIDACRVELAAGEDGEGLNGGAYSGGKRGAITGDTRSAKAAGMYGEDGRLDPEAFEPPTGRWPPNTLLSHSQLCTKVGTRVVKGNGHYPAARPAGSQMSGPSGHAGQTDLEEAHTGVEEIEAWECVEGCPIAALDAQTGVLKSGKWNGKRNKPKTQSVFGAFDLQDETGTAGDEGGASRFFPQLNFDPEFDGPPFFYSAKCARAEREAGCDGLPIRNLARSDGAQAAENAGADEYTGGSQGIGLNTVAKVKNPHPTVKPVALMRWLVRLVTPPGGTVLDCFLGSGTTGMAALYEGFDFIGVEKDADYMEIARARIAWVEAGGKLKEKKPAKARKAKVPAVPKVAVAPVPPPEPVITPAPEPPPPSRGVSAFLARMRSA